MSNKIIFRFSSSENINIYIKNAKKNMVIKAVDAYAHEKDTTRRTRGK